MRFPLTAPLHLTSRSMPGVQVGGAVISVQPTSYDSSGRFTMSYFIDTVTWSWPSSDGPVAMSEGLSVLLTAGDSVFSDLPRKAIAALCASLAADTESLGERVAQWARAHRHELRVLCRELDAEASL